METAVTGSPLGFTAHGQVMSNSPQRRLAGGSGEAGPTDAVEASGAVEAAAGVKAGPAGAVVHVDGAEASGETGRAEAREAVDAVQAGGAVGTRLHQAVVNVGLTTRPREAGQTVTRQLRRKTISVFTQTAIYTGRPNETQEDRHMREGQWFCGFYTCQVLNHENICV